MYAQSRPVISNQQHTHPGLPALLQRHLQHRHQAPVTAYNQAAFDTLLNSLQKRPRPLILDSFCGTGYSSAIIARQFPDHLVVGIDKSSHRLAKYAGPACDNCLLIQADCEAIWQLLQQHKFSIARHYIYYPNPWPKAHHLRRRVHGSAAFSWLLQLGGRVELRSNWNIYVEEFALAMHLAGHSGCISRIRGIPPRTLFERKYHASGHSLWAFEGAIAPPLLSYKLE